MHLSLRSSLPILFVCGIAACTASASSGDDGFGPDNGVDSGTGAHPGQKDGSAPGTDGGTTPLPGDDSGTTPPPGTDGGFGGWDSATPSGYPAAHLMPPVEVYGGDRLLYAPKIVTVTFSGETQASTFETFDDQLTQTSWWDQVTAGYCDKAGKCIGRGSSGGHIRLSMAAAKSYTDNQDPSAASTIKDLIKSQIATQIAPDENTLYVIYFPDTTTITMPNGNQMATSCQQFGGYHMHVNVNGVDAAYAIIPQCKPLFGVQVAVTSVDVSHEVIEATTDPLVGATTANGYYMDQTHDAWLAISAAEVGDVCALLKDFAANPTAMPSPDEYTESGMVLQRSFSNKSLLANHDPCVPEMAPTYFNVAPEVEKLVMKTGDTKTIELTGFSNGPTSDWDVKVIDFASLVNPFAPKVLGLTLDNAKANNGTKLHLTIKVNGTVDPNNGNSFVIVSTSGNQVAFWPGIVEAQ